MAFSGALINQNFILPGLIAMMLFAIYYIIESIKNKQSPISENTIKNE